MKKLTFALIILLASSLISNNEETKQNQLCNSKASCEDINSTCKCWCSVKCGPRDKKPGVDKPQVKNGTCFCADRDIELSNGCPFLTKSVKK